MPVEYGQRRGMGWRYAQDPAQQDWQQELALQYAQQPANRALAENARQFNASQGQQNKQFKTTNRLTAEQNQLTRDTQEKTSKLGFAGNVLGALGTAYFGRDRGGMYGQPTQQPSNWGVQDYFKRKFDSLGRPVQEQDPSESTINNTVGGSQNPSYNTMPMSYFSKPEDQFNWQGKNGVDYRPTFASNFFDPTHNSWEAMGMPRGGDGGEWWNNNRDNTGGGNTFF